MAEEEERKKKKKWGKRSDRGKKALADRIGEVS